MLHCNLCEPIRGLLFKAIVNDACTATRGACVHLVRGFVPKRLMGPLGIVQTKVPSQPQLQFYRRPVAFQVELFVLDAPPRPFAASQPHQPALTSTRKRKSRHQHNQAARRIETYCSTPTTPYRFCTPRPSACPARPVAVGPCSPDCEARHSSSWSDACLRPCRVGDTPCDAPYQQPH